MARDGRADEPWITYWMATHSKLLQLVPPGIPADEAEDSVQEVALAALLNPPRRKTWNAFLAFTKKVLNNKCADTHRRRSRLREHVTDPADLDSRRPPDTGPVRHGQGCQLLKLLVQKCLSRRERDVVTLWFGGMTEIKAIARKLGVRPSTARQYWNSALRKLRKALEH